MLSQHWEPIFSNCPSSHLFEVDSYAIEDGLKLWLDAHIFVIAFHPTHHMVVISSYGGDFKIWVCNEKVQQKDFHVHGKDVLRSKRETSGDRLHES
ncbi:hypothetical protein VNO77_22463 [Canavalia gladiata]|uniref:Uncharacterized protein n=1 Tax=Canavalia gladiata TaxID=3824 RepID=A0AAN9L7V2_CANGL